MRQLVPGMSEKTDKATVFEFSARYIHFLKNFVGTHHDKVSQLKWKSKKDLLRGLLSDCIAWLILVWVVCADTQVVCADTHSSVWVVCADTQVCADTLFSLHCLCWYTGSLCWYTLQFALSVLIHGLSMLMHTLQFALSVLIHRLSMLMHTLQFGLFVLIHRLSMLIHTLQFGLFVLIHRLSMLMHTLHIASYSSQWLMQTVQISSQSSQWMKSMVCVLQTQLNLANYSSWTQCCQRRRRNAHAWLVLKPHLFCLHFMGSVSSCTVLARLCWNWWHNFLQCFLLEWHLDCTAKPDFLSLLLAGLPDQVQSLLTDTHGGWTSPPRILAGVERLPPAFSRCSSGSTKQTASSARQGFSWQTGVHFTLQLEEICLKYWTVNPPPPLPLQNVIGITRLVRCAYYSVWKTLHIRYSDHIRKNFILICSQQIQKERHSISH